MYEELCTYNQQAEKSLWTERNFEHYMLIFGCISVFFPDYTLQACHLIEHALRACLKYAGQVYP